VPGCKAATCRCSPPSEGGIAHVVPLSQAPCSVSLHLGRLSLGARPMCRNLLLHHYQALQLNPRQLSRIHTQPSGSVPQHCCHLAHAAQCPLEGAHAPPHHCLLLRQCL
jgi:hypothetical protein